MFVLREHLLREHFEDRTFDIKRKAYNKDMSVKLNSKTEQRGQGRGKVHSYFQ